LRISKESIFTGLNNFNVYSITEKRASTRFGFTFKEVQALCHYYSIGDKINIIKEWYDGYLFGNTEIYNPWSVLKYIDQTFDDEYDAISFWANTSGNDIVKEYIEKADTQLHDEFEQLINGESIEKKLNPELTYREMDRISNIYSFLLFTGYLKVHKIIDKSHNIYELEIPNKEVKEIYINTFDEWFNDYTDSKIYDLFNALDNSQEDIAMDLLNDILENSISYYDNYEAFYHCFLVGLFNGYNIESNKESGDGRFDISILPKRITNNVIVIECKHSDSLNKLVQDSQDGVQQIIDKKYDQEFKKRGYQHIVGYGIAFYKKTCFISQ
ncbi:MAG: ATP-binding protein, partial [Erysipelotrichaceae bacterium]|nr:ATP-binding protein [Erysipelotrichaceae bacterium]